MSEQQATFEIWRSGRWHAAAVLRSRQSAHGYAGACDFEYQIDYAAQFASGNQSLPAALSRRYPVDFDLHDEPRWPAFVLDLLPSGFGREQWLDKLDLRDGPQADWPLLLRGTAFPPGNLRVAEAVAAKDLSCKVPTAQGDLLPMNRHPGFSRDQVLQRGEAFVEYAYQHGIYAAGATDVQGVAPKLLLQEDRQGRWHAEGILPDENVAASWILKRPRGTKQADQKVLRNEAAYMQVAKSMGLQVFADLQYTQDSLLIPRFDRVLQPGAPLQRLGLESLCSLVGISDYGVRIEHDDLCAALVQHSSQPAVDVLEYIQRDVLNVVLGNKDNHARNSAVLKWPNGKVRLSPLFDFAPMYLDPEGIARVCRWRGDAEEAGIPDWAQVMQRYNPYLEQGYAHMRQFGERLQRLPEIARQAGVDDDIIQHCAAAVQQHTAALMQLKGGD